LVKQRLKEVINMARGDKSKYSDKQKRTAAHIEKSYENKGVPEQEAEKRAWATVNKQSGGGEKSGGSGEKKSPEAKKNARKTSAQRAVATKHGVPRSESEKFETKASLLQKAREKNIAGRSSMSKPELLDALKKH
jgi:hypothetical protein